MPLLPYGASPALCLFQSISCSSQTEAKPKTSMGWAGRESSFSKQRAAVQPGHLAPHLGQCQPPGLSLIFVFCLADMALPAHLPQPCTIRHLVTHYLDISCVPRRSFFELLSYLSPDELEQEKLQEFSSAQGQEELYSYCNRPRRTTLEVGQLSK